MNDYSPDAIARNILKDAFPSLSERCVFLAQKIIHSNKPVFLLIDRGMAYITSDAVKENGNRYMIVLEHNGKAWEQKYLRMANEDTTVFNLITHD